MKILYSGTADQVNQDVGDAIGNASLEPGTVYDLPASLAKRLAESDVRWSLVGKKKGDAESDAASEAGAPGDDTEEGK
jgi:hypothetical protein